MSNPLTQYVPDSNYQYVNLDLFNNTNNNILQRFTRNYSEPIIGNSSNFKMSVVRFSIDCSTFPIHIVETTQSGNVNQMKDTITVRYTTNSNTQNLTWVPENLGAPVPTVLSPQQIDSDYYYLYHMDHFVDILNTALENAFTAVKTASAPTLNSALTPYFRYNKETKKFSLIVDSNFFDDVLANPIEIFVNRTLQNKLESFTFEYDSSLPSDFYARFRCGNETGLNVIFPPVNLAAFIIPPNNIPNNLYVISQSYSSVSAFNSLKALVLTSNLLPVVPEFVDVGVPFGTIEDQTNTLTTTSNIESIITDFRVPDDITDTTPRIYEYLPSGEYRYISLQGSNSKVDKIDITISVRDQYGNIRPLFLAPASTSSIKILFVQMKEEIF